MEKTTSKKSKHEKESKEKESKKEVEEPKKSLSNVVSNAASDDEKPQVKGENTIGNEEEPRKDENPDDLGDIKITVKTPRQNLNFLINSNTSMKTFGLRLQQLFQLETVPKTLKRERGEKSIRVEKVFKNAQNDDVFEISLDWIEVFIHSQKNSPLRSAIIPRENLTLDNLSKQTRISYDFLPNIGSVSFRYYSPDGQKHPVNSENLREVIQNRYKIKAKFQDCKQTSESLINGVDIGIRNAIELAATCLICLGEPVRSNSSMQNFSAIARAIEIAQEDGRNPQEFDFVNPDFPSFKPWKKVLQPLFSKIPTLNDMKVWNNMKVTSQNLSSNIMHMSFTNTLIPGELDPNQPEEIARMFSPIISNLTRDEKDALTAAAQIYNYCLGKLNPYVALLSYGIRLGAGHGVFSKVPKSYQKQNCFQIYRGIRADTLKDSEKRDLLEYIPKFRPVRPFKRLETS